MQHTKKCFSNQFWFSLQNMQYTCIILLSAALMVQVYGQQQRKNVPSFSRVQAKINIRPAPASSSTPAAVTKGAGKMPLQYENSWKALDTLRGHQSLQNDELRMIMLSAQPGVDYPALSYIPENPGFTCQSVNQPGFYADPTTMCQGKVGRCLDESCERRSNFTKWRDSPSVPTGISMRNNVFAVLARYFWT